MRSVDDLPVAPPRLTCGQKVAYELDQFFCKPTARCFKGISIMTLILAMANFVMAVVIPRVIVVQGGTEHNEINDSRSPGPDEIADRITLMRRATVILTVVFVLMSFVSLLFFCRWRKVESRRRGESLLRDEDFGQVAVGHPV